MLNKLKALREEREEGFTLIELLVVILIIGILAAIAIPVFLNQRQTANDGAVESDVRNVASAVETWVTQQKGANTTIANVASGPQHVADIRAQVKPSNSVKIAIKGSANAYCIVAVHPNGKKYLGDAAINPDPVSSLTYESFLGGMNKGTTGTPKAFTGACAGAGTWQDLTP